MKGNKKLLVVAVLLLLITVSFTTYAIYKSSAEGDSTIQTAAWVVKVGTTDIVANNTFTVDSINWGNSTVGKNGKIAPGDTGTVNIVLDASGSEVDVAYEISFGDFATTVNNTKLTAKAASGSSLTGTIPYAAGTDAMKVTIPLEVKWEAVDEATQNATDIDTAAKSLTLPVTVTAKQNPGA